jgi:hypothetical protein
MLALQTCFGKPSSLSGKRKYVCAFSRLGNTFLGKLILEVTPNPATLVDTIRNLQQQAARLLPHPTRPFVYMHIWLGCTLLPSMTYSECLNTEQIKQALHSLQNVTSFAAYLQWDEDDSTAIQEAEQLHNAKFLNNMLYLRKYTHELNPCVRVFEYTCAPTNVYLMTWQETTNDVIRACDLSVLSNFKHMTHLTLACCHIDDWTWAKCLSIKYLDVRGSTFVCLQGCLPLLDTLVVADTCDLLLLPLDSLKKLYLFGNNTPNLDHFGKLYPHLCVVPLCFNHLRPLWEE